MHHVNLNREVISAFKWLPTHALRRHERTRPEAITALGGSADTLYAGTGDIMRNALADLVRRAEAAGDIRPVADPFDLLRAVAGVLYVSPAADPQAESGARNVIDLLIAGLRKT